MKKRITVFDLFLERKILFVNFIFILYKKQILNDGIFYGGVRIKEIDQKGKFNGDVKHL